MTHSDRSLLRTAFLLSIFTIVYNVAEGVISVFFGVTDDTLALLGFGVDSFVEVISGVGIAHMIVRMKRVEVTERDQFESLALKITGVSFYLLTAGLVTGSVINVIRSVRPETTIVGIIVSLVSILAMFFLMRAKLRVGYALDSNAIVADAKCTRTCFNLSLILLASSFLYEIFRIGYIDVIGSLGIAYVAFNEGREAFEKAAAGKLACCEDECGQD